MVLPILYFLFDFVFLGVSNNWSVRLLLTYFIFYMCIHHKDRFITKHSIGILLLLLAQDVFIYGRFGISLLYLAPILLCMFISSFFCDIKMFAFRYLFLISALFSEFFILKKGYFAAKVPFKSLFLSISVNIILMIILVPIGMRGNRFFYFFNKKRGKSGLQIGRMPHK
jgi:hypothetical protein